MNFIWVFMGKVMCLQRGEDESGATSLWGYGEGTVVMRKDKWYSQCNLDVPNFYSTCGYCFPFHANWHESETSSHP